MSEKTITNEQYCFFLNENNVAFNGSYGILEGTGEVVKIDTYSKNIIHSGKWLPAPGKENYPVEYLPLQGVERYCSWLDGRLPTEAEWEYACRAGTTTAFNTGYRLTTAQANFDGTYPYIAGDTPGIKSLGMKPVGSYPPNAWGLYDMHGNVLEWCLDAYGAKYEDFPGPNPIGHGLERVARGGHWMHGAEYCRSAARINVNYSPSQYAGGIGFRVVRPII